MPCVAQQREAVLPKAHASFNADKKEVQYDGYPKDFTHLPVVGSYMMMVMMMFVTHTFLFLLQRCRFFCNVGNP